LQKIVAKGGFVGYGRGIRSLDGYGEYNVQEEMIDRSGGSADYDRTTARAALVGIQGVLSGGSSQRTAIWSDVFLRTLVVMSNRSMTALAMVTARALAALRALSIPQRILPRSASFPGHKGNKAGCIRPIIDVWKQVWRRMNGVCIQ